MCNARSTTPFNKKNASSASSSESELLTNTAPVCAPEPTEIDISNFSAEDLQSLKQEDPFLYYGRAVDSTMLTALSAIASAQAEPKEETMTRCKQFLDYAATHQDAILTYKASDMVLVIHSDMSYLSEP